MTDYYEADERVPTCDPDRGEDQELAAILREYGAEDYIEREVERRAMERALPMVRDLLYIAACPPPRSDLALHICIMGYAVGVAGLPSMRKSAKRFGVTVADISKRAREFRETYALPQSPYMKTDTAAKKYATTNARRRKRQ